MSSELAETDRMRRELVANVSHELRTPISALRASLENVIDGVQPADPETLIAMRGQLERLGRHGRAAARPLADGGRGSVPLDLRRVPAPRGCSTAPATRPCSRPATASRSTSEASPPDLRIVADEVRMQQVRHQPDRQRAPAFPGRRARDRAAACARAPRSASTSATWGRASRPDQRSRVFERFYRARRLSLEQRRRPRALDRRSGSSRCTAARSPRPTRSPAAAGWSSSSPAPCGSEAQVAEGSQAAAAPVASAAGAVSRVTVASPAALAVLGTSLLAALIVPGSLPGLGLAICSSLMLAAAAVGSGARSEPWRAVLLVGCAALAATPVLRDASWLVVLNLGLAFFLGSIALIGSASWRGLGQVAAGSFIGPFIGPIEVISSAVSRVPAVEGGRLSLGLERDPPGGRPGGGLRRALRFGRRGLLRASRRPFARSLPAGPAGADRRGPARPVRGRSACVHRSQPAG